jgi:hypothetical protein
LEEFVHKSGIGVGLVRRVRQVGHEGGDFFRSRQQAGQIERHTADERGGIGLGCRRASVFLQGGQDEAVEVIFRPSGVLHGGWLGGAQRLKGPMSPALLDGGRFGENRDAESYEEKKSHRQTSVPADVF